MHTVRNFDIADILVLHASSMFNKDGALIFLGPSGTGKSTMCDLLSPYMCMLAEDKVYLVSQGNGKWCVIEGDGCLATGIKLSSNEDLLKLPYAPLRAVFRLYQTTEPILRKLDMLSVCRDLTDAFFEIAWQRNTSLAIKKQAFAGLAEVARLFAGYEFHFDLSTRTLSLLDREMKFLENSICG